MASKKNNIQIAKKTAGISKDTKKKQSAASTKKDIIHKEMNIGEVVEKYPETVSVMMSYGLHCIGCHVSLYESIEQGSLAHGMNSSDIGKMIKDMNNVREKFAKTPFIISEKAAKKIKELAKGKEFGLRIAINMEAEFGESRFLLSLENKPKQNEKTISADGVNIFIDEETLKYAKGCTINFIKEGKTEGFTMNRE
jgi:hybrid cluster-associated redox disulfide protein